MTPPKLIDIVGNIKIDESKPERIKYLIACIKSFEFLNEDCTFILNLESPSFKLYKLVEKTLRDCEFEYVLLSLSPNITYGQNYMTLLKYAQSKYVLNFIEDAFCLIDDREVFKNEMKHMEPADLMRACFHEIETKSIHDDMRMHVNHCSYTFLMNEYNFGLFQKHYGSRYYIGVNFITTLEFAKKFWNRDTSAKRPHEYEVVEYNQYLEHICTIPGVEIMACIDDPHGEENSHLLARKEEKFWRIFNLIQA